MEKIYIIGIGMGNPDTITIRGKKLIDGCQGIIGAGRMVESFASADKITAKAIDPKEIYKWISDHKDIGSICVLMSGDVGFFSGAKKLSKLLENEGYETVLVPGISSVQYLCAQVQKSWDDVKILSLHGGENNFIGAVSSNHKVFLLTGGDRTPDKICQKLTRHGLGQVKVHIGQRLSYMEEEIVSGVAEDLGDRSYDPLSVMLVENSQLMVKNQETHGLEDQEFIRGNVPMTKQEVRSVAISKLGISKDDVVYDIGAGTGSVSIEMALQATEGMVYAVEVNEEALGLIGQNREKFRLANLEIVPGSAPLAIENLPAPDKVFIGGTKGKLYEILRVIQTKSPNAAIVIDAIALESVTNAIESLSATGFTKIDVIQVFSARAKTVANYHMMMGLNPVFIIKGERDQADGIQI